MLISYFPFLAAGKSSLLGGEDWLKILQILKDNPHVICVLRKEKILLFSKESRLRISKDLFPSFKDALIELSLDLKLAGETDQFWIFEVPKAEFVLEMEKLAHEITAFLDENIEFLKEGDVCEVDHEKDSQKARKSKVRVQAAEKVPGIAERRAEQKGNSSSLGSDTAHTGRVVRDKPA